MSKLTLRIARALPVQPLKAMAVFALVGITAGSAGAQSLDYGALQQLFGEPVTSSAIGTPQRARDVPANIEIVTADDIRRSGAIDIPGVLSHVLGVDVLRWSVLGAACQPAWLQQPDESTASGAHRWTASLHR